MNFLCGLIIALALLCLYQYFSDPETTTNKEDFLVLRNEPYYSNCLQNVFGKIVCYPYGYRPLRGSKRSSGPYRPWPYPYRHTHLMSYDLRGDPYYIDRQPYVWGNTDFLPYWA
jgi:hypothetical protein